MINCSNIESCHLKRHMLGNSTDGDSNDNDEGVDQGIPMRVAVEPQLPMPNPTLDAKPPPVFDSSRDASIVAAPLSTPVIDKFYNNARKALHLEAIIPKKELGWWMNCEMQK